ncbi:MAG: hypothetical protein EB116_14115, partial [Betaproteobacteria bacterium]|nr:hypothetical protein [Betaproteobacteria bacterium]
MGTIVGTDGDDILRGDGQSPIFGGKGNDTVFLTGAEKEANFDPGNDTFKTSGKSEWGAVGFNLAVADSFNFSLKNPILNFTTKPITTSGKVISPNTGLDPWGGIDTFELGADITRLDLYPGQLDDSIYIDNRYRPFFWYEANQPNGNDLIISSNYPTINIGGSSEK